MDFLRSGYASIDFQYLPTHEVELLLCSICQRLPAESLIRRISNSDKPPMPSFSCVSCKTTLKLDAQRGHFDAARLYFCSVLAMRTDSVCPMNPFYVIIFSLTSPQFKADALYLETEERRWTLVDPPCKLVSRCDDLPLFVIRPSLILVSSIQAMPPTSLGASLPINCHSRPTSPPILSLLMYVLFRSSYTMPPCGIQRQFLPSHLHRCINVVRRF